MYITCLIWAALWAMIHSNFSSVIHTFSIKQIRQNGCYSIPTTVRSSAQIIPTTLPFPRNCANEAPWSLDGRHQRSNGNDGRGGRGGEGFDTRTRRTRAGVSLHSFLLFGMRCASPGARRFSSPSPRPSQRCVILWELVGIGNSFESQIEGESFIRKEKG